MNAGFRAPARPPRILLVDDEPDNLELLAIILAHEGFLPVTASSGGEALDAVAKDAPDLVLLDVMMPVMDGFEVLRRLKADHATRGIPVIMLTAMDQPAAQKVARSAGAADFIGKPLDRADLCARVRTQLREKH